MERNWQSIGIALSSYLVAQLVFAVSLAQTSDFQIPDVVFDFGFWLTFVIPGYLAARFAKCSAVFNAAVVGLLIGVGWQLLAYIGREPGESYAFANQVLALARIQLLVLAGSLIWLIQRGLKKT